MNRDRAQGAIIELPTVRGNLATVEMRNSAAGRAAARPAPARYQRRLPQKKAKRLGVIPFALAVLIIAGLLAAFMPWDGGQDKPAAVPADPSPSHSSGTSLPATVPAVKEEPEYIPDAAEVEALAKLIFGEAGVVPSTTEKAAVVWCVLNRVDDPRFPDTVLEVITAPSQFTGYSADNPVYEEYEALAADVLKRYHAERDGDTDAGRVLPADYCFFTGDGRRNYFTNEWKSGDTWGWTLSSPYDD